jgi:adenine-specific DNA-methyltransferase
MNSKVVNWYFDKICGESGVGTNRWKKFYVEEIPLPEENDSVISKIESLVDQILTAKKDDSKADTVELEREIDILVFKLYGLTEEEIKVVAPEMALSEEERKVLGF